MKKCALLVFLLLCNLLYGQIQSEMNTTARQAYEKADCELNLVHNQIRTRFSKDTLVLQKLRDSQLVCIQFRDLSVKALFPYEDNSLHFGSMYPMHLYGLLEELTNDKIKQLREFYFEGKYNLSPDN